MEFNLKAWKMGLVSAACSSIVMFLTTLITFSQPPPAWDLFRLAIGPATIAFFSTVYQMVSKKEGPGGP